MAEGTAPAVAETNTNATQDMEVENIESAPNTGEKDSSKANSVDCAANGESNQKRVRDEGESEEDKDNISKKQKLEEKSVEEERLEKLDEGAEEKKRGPVSLGPKSFGSSVEMFDYFYQFLHHWPPYLNVNKFEHIMLLELLKKGHTEPEKKIGGGIHAFQVRNHPMWKSRCFFLVREDESVDDFSFRKCVDHILPLPEEMRSKSEVNKALGGGKGRGGKGGGRGRGGRGYGKGGKSRN